MALAVFLGLTYLVVPFWQRYRNRYSQYLPLESISNQTSSLRHRIQSGIGRFFLPSVWRQRLQGRLAVDGGDDLGIEDNSDDGEELGDVDDDRRRQLSSMEAQQQSGPDSTRRLSRE